MLDEDDMHALAVFLAGVIVGATGLFLVLYVLAGGPM